MRDYANFTGFSLGTDHLILERNKNSYVRIGWLNNLKFLHEHEVRYSLTVTLGNDFDLFALIKFLKHLHCRPDFLTIAETEGVSLSEDVWSRNLELIHATFHNKEIKVGFRNRF